MKDFVKSIFEPTRAGAGFLMPNRVLEILVASAAYDRFLLEEDGPLTHRVFSEHFDLNMSYAPRLTHTPTARGALDLLSQRRFDLVLTTPRLADTDFITLTQQVKASYPQLPVVALAFSEGDLHQYPDPEACGIDQVMFWTGDEGDLIASCKLIEDAKNVDHDTASAGVRVVLLVEDSPRFYSRLLSQLYRNMLSQAGSLRAEGVDPLGEQLRMRMRPKILLAETFERGMELADKYAPYLCAVITDARLPRGGTLDANAGPDLVRAVREKNPDLPVLLQSSEADLEETVQELEVGYVHKGSPKLMTEVHDFVVRELGFGPFIFRTPDGRDVDQARNANDLEERLPKVPLESFEDHARRNDFARWLTSRSLFEVAREVRAIDVDELGAEKTRDLVLDSLKRARLEREKAAVISVKKPKENWGRHLMRVESGSVGGKGRGIAFLHKFLSTPEAREHFDELAVRVPRAALIGTSAFDRFVEADNLHQWALTCEDDREIIERFLGAKFWFFFDRDLRRALDVLTGPLSVRSSSLLEDHQFRPFSGIYATYLLPNNHPDPDTRFEQLKNAVKAVYASAYGQNARAYMRGTPYTFGQEKMGVVVQQLVGREYGERFYPHASGIAMSHNFYPAAGQRSEDGIALMALGLGHMVVGGGRALRFSPGAPRSLPQFWSARETLKNSQREFFALNTSQHDLDFLGGQKSTLELCDLEDAESDGTLTHAAGVYIPEDDVIRDDLTKSGPRVVTFDSLLKYETVPLARTIGDVLALCRSGMGCEVEIEFALDMTMDEPVLWILQVRPLASPNLQASVSIDDVADEDLFGKTPHSMGHGQVRVKHIIYVKETCLEAADMKRAAVKVGELNAALEKAGANYLLIGPGRWGTSDPNLGVPVRWRQISGARVIVETTLGDRWVEPSQGTHFFQNITSMGIGYLTVKGDEHDFLDSRWLSSQPSASEDDLVRHIELPEPVDVLMDGRSNQAVLLKPGILEGKDS